MKKGSHLITLWDGNFRVTPVGAINWELESRSYNAYGELLFTIVKKDGGR